MSISKKKKLSKSELKKRELVVVSLLSRLTDFELQSMDEDYIDWCEGLREHIATYQKESHE